MLNPDEVTRLADYKNAPMLSLFLSGAPLRQACPVGIVCKAAGVQGKPHCIALHCIAWRKVLRAVLVGARLWGRMLRTLVMWTAAGS